MSHLFRCPSAVRRDPEVEAWFSTPDEPAGLLEGAGKRMRHVRLRWAQPVNADALGELIEAAYRDLRLRLETEGA